MKKFWPVIIIFSLVLIFARPFLLKGLLPIPSDTIVGLYNPFRDLYAKEYPRGVPFKNFLITDPVRQQIPWKYLATHLEKNVELPLWNPYSFSGSPFLANFQTAAFYPLNILFFILPFSFAWSVFILLQPLLAGIFLYLYLRNLRLHPIAALLGGITFAFSGFGMVWLEWGNIFHTLLWVPLILLAKDKLLEKWTTKWAGVFLFAEVAALFAGHIQVWFYSLLVTNSYLFLRIYQKTKLQKTKQFVKQYTKNYLPFLLVGAAMFTITAIQWIPTLQFILHSARSVDQNYLTTAGWFIPYQNLLQFIVPDFFGNPATLNYWGVWNYAEFSGYIGILPLLFVLFAIVFRHDKKTWFFGMVALLALLFALPTPLGKLPYQLNIPLLATSQPTRLLALVDLSLAILVALGADLFIRQKTLKILWMCEVLIGLFIILWVTVLKFHFGIPAEDLVVVKRNLVFPSIFVFVSTLILTLGSIFRFKQWYIYFAILCVVLVSVDLLRFSEKFNPFTQSQYLFPQEKVLTYLQQHAENQRIMTADSRILAPNFSVMYKLQSVEGYDPLYLKNYAEFIVASEREKPDIHSPFGFNRIITPHNYNSRLMDLLGVKYVLSLDELHISKLSKVFADGQTKVYENKNVVSRAFFVSHVENATSSQDAIHLLFAIKDFKDTAVVNSSNNFTQLSQGTVQIKAYTPNEVTLLTRNSGNGFLVLTDVYYPSWRATIDGKSTEIYETDYAFRGVFVPKGEHTIVFSDHIF